LNIKKELKELKVQILIRMALFKDDNYDNYDNYVITQYKSAQGVSEFLLRNAYYALNSARADIIFEPFPLSWKHKLSEKINDITKIKKINKNIETVLSVIVNSYNDIEIIDNFGIETYELVRFILESNKMMIKVDNLLKSTDIIQVNTEIYSSMSKNKDKNKDIDNDILSSILQFKLIHTQLVEDKFKDKSTTYLYHGSSYENWYSIMRNGVKIGSDSKYFMNGAAYGKGVYLAIFEVENNPKWNKGNSIYVIDDENALILRYLLVFRNAYDPLLQGIFRAINVKLNNGGIKKFEKEKKEIEAKNITTIHNKRLMREYKMIMKQTPEKLGFRIALAQEDNLSKWMVYITNPENPRLEEQMRRLNISAIEIEITFKDTYPISPPFIRVVYPHFQFHSGHITVGGSLCMEMLTNQGWSPTFNVENVITQIKLAISDGGGAIDEVNYKKRYTMDEAVDAFKRVLASHG